MDTPETPGKTFNQIYTEMLIESVKETKCWIVGGTIGFCIFLMSLGLLGVISIFKVLFF